MIYVAGQKEDSVAEVALQYNDGYNETILSLLFTRVRISELPSFALVWPSNWASVSFTEITGLQL